jgi:hypothetical protein
MADDHQETPTAELDRMRALYNGRDSDGGPAGFAIQVRDKIIRKLIDELKAARGRSDGAPNPKP